MSVTATLPIASARMYSWSPSLTAAWCRLLEWVSVRAGVPLSVLDQADPLPLDDLWAREDLGCVFMCGYPWALRADPPHLLAAPVPSPPRYGGRPVYFTDFIVRADSAYRTLEDTFGGCIAYSAEHSHSGYNAARFHLLSYRTPSRPTLYRRALGPLHRQLPVIDAVIDGQADVGPIDGYALDLLRRHGAERAERVRVIATTVAAPSAPLVASPRVDADSRERLITALLEAEAAPALASTLDELLLARFVRVETGDFEVFLQRQRAAEAAGYPKLA
ncbi:MAG TPA: PhnD/SsuA/transferrin family substrate-binding protein [Methylomirabilota bacterium]|jgi:ABC-type phosphate/phosphonate transport system substrate-binding protein|nr:PhnD/SsuA/transferrin family substrate-binding protein [Methylomirabilota bacterium]